MVRLRYRVDGALADVTPRRRTSRSRSLPPENHEQSGHRGAASSARWRMRVRVGGRDIDLRVSFLPTVHGENA